MRFLKLIFCILFTSNLFSQNKFNSDSLNVINYNINLNILDFENKKIDGFCELKLTSEKDLNKIVLDFEGLKVDSITSNKKNLTFNQLQQTLNIDFKLNKNDTAYILVYYKGTPKIDPSGWGGFYIGNHYAYNLGIGFKDNPHNYGRVWFPCVDNFTDKATYNFAIKVPSYYTAVCNGELLKVNSDVSNNKTYFWELKTPIPTYLASVSVNNYILLYDTLNYNQKKIPIEIYTYPNLKTNTLKSFSNLNIIASIYQDLFGEYEWNKIGFAVIPFAGGAMEHATCISYPYNVIDGTLKYESLMAHELSHSWFGNLVTCSNAKEMWLNEGWASYCEPLYKEFLYGKNEYYEHVKKNHFNVLTLAHINDNGYYPVYGIPHEITYGTTVYDKSADIIHSLRKYINNDSLFFYAVRKYIEKYKFSNASTVDLIATLNEYTKTNLNEFFYGWVYDSGFAHFAIENFKVNSTNNLKYNLELSVNQRLLNKRSFIKNNRIKISVYDKNWNCLDTLINFDEKYNGSFNLNFAPECVILDRDNDLMDATTKDFVVIKKNGVYNFYNTLIDCKINNIKKDSVLLFITHNWISPNAKNVENVKVSNSRYWTINGIFPEINNYEVYFSYLKDTIFNDTIFDNNLLKSNKSKDSLVLLYREFNSNNWNIIPSKIMGDQYNGYLSINKLQKGYYTLGIITTTQNNNNLNNIIIKPIYENKSFFIENKNNYAIKINVLNANNEIIRNEVIAPNESKIIKIGKSESNKITVKILKETDIIDSKEIDYDIKK